MNGGEALFWGVLAIASAGLVIGLAFLLKRLERGGILSQEGGTASRLGNAALEVQEILEPGKRQIVEVRREKATDPARKGESHR
ncbi:MAG: hypothetical protein KBD01_11690 [Acidobacteria bacterium]|nr:hypothetical protein [Acidobacteriota bacterium]